MFILNNIISESFFISITYPMRIYCMLQNNSEKTFNKHLNQFHR